MQALEVDKHDRVKRMVATSDAQNIVVAAMKRFITLPELLVPCCLLIRHGLSEERAPRRDQISSLQKLQLVELLLAVNKSPLHLVSTVSQGSTSVLRRFYVGFKLDHHPPLDSIRSLLPLSATQAPRATIRDYD